MPGTQVITDWIADNLQITAPLAALFVSWLLYGVLGKRVLGADDDYWPMIRRRLLPLLDKVGATSGLYAAHQQSPSEFVGVVEEIDEGQLERELEAAGFHRNPLASLKTSPQGWESDGSWARRHGRIRWLGDALREVSLPIAGPVARMLGRFFQSSGEVFAKRQTHVTLYARENGVWLYAHSEANSLNPLTSWKHYLGRGQSHTEGKRRVRTVLTERNIPYTQYKIEET